MEAVVQQVGIEFVTAAGDYIHGLDYTRLSVDTVRRRFVASFGVSPRHAAFVWLYCKDSAYGIDQGRTVLHLLWTLNLLKTDDTEHVLHGRWRADEKTIRKWTRIFMHVLSELNVVRKVREMH